MNIMAVGEVEKVIRVSDKNKVQDRFFIDVSEDVKSLELIQGLLKEVNTKKYGRKLILKDLVLVSLTKLKQKDLEALKESSVQGVELLKRQCDMFNEANNTDYSPYDYAFMMLKKNGTLA
jgi:hypothetical protein